jgi:hypothetical protein
MRAAIVMMCLALTGCGPVWDGTFEGFAVSRQTCSDGSSSTDTFVYVWNIDDNRGALTITTNGDCSPLSATVQGNQAQMSRKECPVQVEPGVAAWQDILTGGTLTLREQSLDISLRGTLLYAFPDGTTGRCDGTIAGSLDRNK